MSAFAGRTKFGIYDRLTPEYAEAVEAGDMPEVDPEEANRILLELDALDYSGKMTMTADCKNALVAFWDAQDKETKKKARWKKALMLDAYLTAFGEGLHEAGIEHAKVAIAIFRRQLLIRRKEFTTEVLDRIGYYTGLIKKITEKMHRQLKAGIPEVEVAKSRRDYERLTHAHRDNEGVIFDRAWKVFQPTWLRPVLIERQNGKTYQKYLPADEG